MLAEVQFALQLAVVRGFGAREARHTMTMVPDAIGCVLVRTMSLRHANRRIGTIRRILHGNMNAVTSAGGC